MSAMSCIAIGMSSTSSAARQTFHAITMFLMTFITRNRRAGTVIECNTLWVFPSEVLRSCPWVRRAKLSVLLQN